MKRINWYRCMKLPLFLLILSGTLGISTIASAEVGQIDGHIWQASSLNEKRAYLMGVSNVVAVNRAIQIKHNDLDPDAAVNHIAAAMDASTIDAAISRIDSWYRSNDSKLDVPVLGVVWLGLVKAMQ
ncbi:hypothetical protein G8770_19920 [Aestuariicella hydrocarbonica]|uniref:Uncharacterized protein n=1 Tax=Pseudomaricurvus hydrocarbonicus TaxID=1470433 RepID=A0A9E5T4D0_9GAMM|nr:hypothetical protein [Aestuariicella hydrocarbonica]NHO67819.1 hypothetical protein [Aestuariicella hydrocarbonica]